MTQELLSYVNEGDTILVKASHFMEFPKVVEALSKVKSGKINRVEINSIFNYCEEWIFSKPHNIIKEREKNNGTESNRNNHNGKRRCNQGGALSGNRTKHSKQLYQLNQSTTSMTEYASTV